MVLYVLRVLGVAAVAAALFLQVFFPEQYAEHIDCASSLPHHGAEVVVVCDFAAEVVSSETFDCFCAWPIAPGEYSYCSSLMRTSGAAVGLVVVDPFHVFHLPGDRHRHTCIS